VAEMIGTTRARASFFMTKFRKVGFIECNGKTGSPYFLVEHGFVRQARDQKRGIRQSVSAACYIYEPSIWLAPQIPEALVLVLSDFTPVRACEP